MPYAEYAASLNRKRTAAGVLFRDERSRVLLVEIDHIPAEEPMPEGLAFVFDGGVITEVDVASIELTDPEIRSAGLYREW